MRRKRFGKNASSDISGIQQCLRDVEIAVINRDGEKLLIAAEQLEMLTQLLDVDDDADITDDVLPYLGMKATCKEIMARLDTLSKQGERLVHLLKRVRDSKVGYDKRTPECSILQGLDVSG